jgi:hypothetical protein
MTKIRVYTPPGTDPDERGKRARAIARRLAAGEALDGEVVTSLPDDGRDIVTLAQGKISAAGCELYPPFKTGMARAFLVGDPATCMLGQTLAEPQPVDASAVELILSPFSVNPDPDGEDGPPTKPVTPKRKA